jgi:hypothetical protein
VGHREGDFDFCRYLSQIFPYVTSILICLWINDPEASLLIHAQVVQKLEEHIKIGTGFYPMERTQEIGMLRAVGMTRGQVVRMVLSEAALMGLIGGVMGLVFGVVLSRLFLSAMTSMSGYRLTFVLPLENILAALLIAFLTSQLTAFLPTLRASRTRILEAIQYE